MKTINLYFQLHQPYRLKTYRFFDIGNEAYYFDDAANRSLLKRIARNCYLPANKILLKQIKAWPGKFYVSFSITGLLLEQLAEYAPEVLASFQELAQTGQVEFLGETYSHSLASVIDAHAFRAEVKRHSQRMQELFEQTPKTFRNTELIYSDDIGKMVYDMGFRTMLTEGAKHILGWKSPNMLYFSAREPKLRLLLKNYQLSDDIAFRFANSSWNEYPMTARKYVKKLTALPNNHELINLFMDYESFGEHQKKETGIFDFLNEFPKEAINSGHLQFSTPSRTVQKHQPVAVFQVPYPISWADEERDLSAWLGNDMQQEAVNKMYALREKVQELKDNEFMRNWERLQASDHFYYMSTKLFADGSVHMYFNSYPSPYDAFINYMNVASDFEWRVNRELKKKKETRPIDELIAYHQQEIQRLKSLQHTTS